MTSPLFGNATAAPCSYLPLLATWRQLYENWAQTKARAERTGEG